MVCKDDHKDHESFYFGKIKSDPEKIKKKLIEEKQLIDSFSGIYNKQIIEKIESIINNWKLLNNIKSNIANKYRVGKRNYQNSMNLKEIGSNENIKEDLQKIVEENDLIEKFNTFFEIYRNILNSDVTLFDTIEKENNTLKEENLSLKESNLQIKDENEDLCNKLETQKETIGKLEEDNENLKLSTQKLEKELAELKNISLSQKKQILDLEKDKENSNKLFIKEKDILKKELNDLKFRQSNRNKKIKRKLR